LSTPSKQLAEGQKGVDVKHLLPRQPPLRQPIGIGGVGSISRGKREFLAFPRPFGGGGFPANTVPFGAGLFAPTNAHFSVCHLLEIVGNIRVLALVIPSEQPT